MNSKINYGEILSKSWQIVWKFKILWIFGILAGCAGGNGSRFNFNSGNFGNNQNFGSGSSGSGQFPAMPRLFQNMRPEAILQEVLAKYGVWIGVGIVLLCVLWIVFYSIGIMGRTGLIHGASKADAGAASLSFGELWSESTPYFWRMFGLNLLIALPVFLVIVIVLAGLGFGVYSMAVNGTQNSALPALIIGGLGIFVVLMCVISIVSVVLRFIAEQAQHAIVLEDLGIMPSLMRGWQVFKSAWISIILMTIILGVISGVTGFVAAIPLIGVIAVAAVGVAGTYAAGAANSMLMPIIIGSCCVIVYLPALLAFSGALLAYSQTAMTIVFRRLTIEPAQPAQPEQPEQPVQPALSSEAAGL